MAGGRWLFWLSKRDTRHFFDFSGGQPERQTPDAGNSRSKGKAKATETGTGLESSGQYSDSLWVDRCEPVTQDDLAVHKRKVSDVRQWLLESFSGGPSGRLKQYRRILALTGPAGTAKTATLRVLSRELNFEIMEWRNSTDEQWSRDTAFKDDGADVGHMEYESLVDKFRSFLARAGTCQPLAQSSSQPYASSQASTVQSSVTPDGKRHVILLEDLPNILHLGTQASFHSAIEEFVSLPATSVAPLVIIVSDAGLRGEDVENDGGSWRRGKEAVDVRSVLPPSLINSPYVTQVRFNPIAPSLMRPALQTLLDKHFHSVPDNLPPKEVIDVIVESSNGDIRSAIMALQFACLTKAGAQAGGATVKGGKQNISQARVMLGAITRREQSLALFHLLGKLLYNKRKGDPPNASASAKDKQQDKELDATLKEPPTLPLHLRVHERRASRVDIENYTQYCTTLDECDSEADWLSWIDSSGGETWHQANPHCFHLLALSTLHSLPSPVVRRCQTPYKPAFFEALKREREAEDGLRDVQLWLQYQHSESGVGDWSRQRIALELGGILKAWDSRGVASSLAPKTHKLFSRMDFGENTRHDVQLTDESEGHQELTLDNEDEIDTRHTSEADHDLAGRGGWLEDDDIEDF
ncbi:predicted protein [Postia placenta Mad-698-R]|uniref:AAA+ ATPase domain-containing protein n=1 Tax=Postia placenta MAD-698-R-SB12 TaxID=670580 RepID=A0A1X6N157_9APHY|nr:hypothetical protein POSPLADRAFT_1066099 [Postia placenta MAD-698-R-SB12]EED82232.1 predicted protein [Postia placenta Mad-698-R]OSX62230.1 hypothetical protein POSPLADRAFT_1066099 [Postia placenta MAD-698-R-SB12]